MRDRDYEDIQVNGASSGGHNCRDCGESGLIMGKREGRLDSIDALRGFDMLFIMGLSAVITRFCVALGFGNECWLAQQMHHPPWIGLTHHDTIFPLFIILFIECLAPLI